MNGYIYMIKNTLNNKVYIGQTKRSPETRFKEHLKLLKSNENQTIHKAIKKYGKDNFYYIILAEGIDSLEKLDDLEVYYIKKYNSMIPNGYNLCPGGNLWRNSRKAKKRFDDDKVEKIIKLYKEGASARKIADVMSCGHHAILKVLKDNNIERRSKTSKLPNRTSVLTKDVMVELYVNKKMSVKEMSIKTGVSERGVRKALERHKLRE